MLACMPNKSLHRYWPYLQIGTDMTLRRKSLSGGAFRSASFDLSFGLSLISIHLFTDEKKRKTKPTSERQINSCQTKTVQEKERGREREREVARFGSAMVLLSVRSDHTQTSGYNREQKRKQTDTTCLEIWKYRKCKSL